MMGARWYWMKEAVVKHNNVILWGKRNKTDGLWDIPITKQYIADNNFQLPYTHTGMYNTNRYKPIEPNSGPRRSERKVKFSNEADDQNKINTIIYNQCVNLIKQQLQEDNSVTNSYQKTAIIREQQNLAVIIWKKEKHKYLVRYLHAAPFWLVA